MMPAMATDLLARLLLQDAAAQHPCAEVQPEPRQMFTTPSTVRPLFAASANWA